MDVLISKQAAIDAVCMEWCNVKHQDCKHSFDVEKGDYYWCDGCETVLRTLPDLPPAQPEIIRCKDCKYKNVYRFPPEYDERDYCEKHEKVTDDVNFCSWAERRIDE